MLWLWVTAASSRQLNASFTSYLSGKAFCDPFSVLARSLAPDPPLCSRSTHPRSPASLYSLFPLILLLFFLDLGYLFDRMSPVSQPSPLRVDRHHCVTCNVPICFAWRGAAPPVAARRPSFFSLISLWLPSSGFTSHSVQRTFWLLFAWNWLSRQPKPNWQTSHIFFGQGILRRAQPPSPAHRSLFIYLVFLVVDCLSRSSLSPLSLSADRQFAIATLLTGLHSDFYSLSLFSIPSVSLIQMNSSRWLLQHVLITLPAFAISSNDAEALLIIFFSTLVFIFLILQSLQQEGYPSLAYHVWNPVAPSPLRMVSLKSRLAERTPTIRSISINSPYGRVFNTRSNALSSRD